MKRSTWLRWTVWMGGLLAALGLGTGTWAEADDDSERTLCFSKTEVGKVPQGWSVDKTGNGEGSAWKVVADKTSPSETGYVLAQTAQSPRRIFNLCVVDESIYRDVEIEVAFKSVKGKVDQGGGPGPAHINHRFATLQALDFKGRRALPIHSSVPRRCMPPLCFSRWETTVRSSFSSLWPTTG